LIQPEARTSRGSTSSGRAVPRRAADCGKIAGRAGSVAAFSHGTVRALPVAMRAPLAIFLALTGCGPAVTPLVATTVSFNDPARVSLRSRGNVALHADEAGHKEVTLSEGYRGVSTREKDRYELVATRHAGGQLDIQWTTALPEVAGEQKTLIRSDGALTPSIRGDPPAAWWTSATSLEIEACAYLKRQARFARSGDINATNTDIVLTGVLHFATISLAPCPAGVADIADVEVAVPLVLETPWSNVRAVNKHVIEFPLGHAPREHDEILYPRAN
jgi:hypothetical protein